MDRDRLLNDLLNKSNSTYGPRLVLVAVSQRHNGAICAVVERHHLGVAQVRQPRAARVVVEEEPLVVAHLHDGVVVRPAVHRVADHAAERVRAADLSRQRGGVNLGQRGAEHGCHFEPCAARRTASAVA